MARKISFEKNGNGRDDIVAYLNYQIPKADGEYIRINKGFPLFDQKDQDRPEPGQDLLIRLAQAHGGQVEITLKCRITILEKKDPVDVSEVAIDIPEE